MKFSITVSPEQMGCSFWALAWFCFNPIRAPRGTSAFWMSVCLLSHRADAPERCAARCGGGGAVGFGEPAGLWVDARLKRHARSGVGPYGEVGGCLKCHCDAGNRGAADGHEDVRVGLHQRDDGLASAGGIAWVARGGKLREVREAVGVGVGEVAGDRRVC